MKFWGVEFAPLLLPLHRRLETLVVFHYVLVFLLMPFVCVLGPIYLVLFTKYWWLVLLYGVWFVYDFETPKKGSRGKQWFKKSPIWRYFRDYFPMTLVKTADLDPDRNYIFGYHPHGVISIGMFGNFGTDATGFSELFPGITPYPCTLNGQFWFPLRREYSMLTGCIEVSKRSIEYVLRQPGKGYAVVIVIGGASEALDARPGTYDVTLTKRKGFVKIALTNGVDLVPVISFGENDLYYQMYNREGSWLRSFQQTLKNICGFSVPFFHGRGIFNYTFGFLPYRRPIWTVVGKPIKVEKCEEPTVEQISEVHQKYKEELLKLFEENKTKYGVAEDVKMNIQ